MELFDRANARTGRAARRRYPRHACAAAKTFFEFPQLFPQSFRQTIAEGLVMRWDQSGFFAPHIFIDAEQRLNSFWRDVEAGEVEAVKRWQHADGGFARFSFAVEALANPL